MSEKWYTISTNEQEKYIEQALFLIEKGYSNMEYMELAMKLFEKENNER
jgi:hypothetical protein